MTAMTIVTMNNMANTNLSAGGPALALWFMQGIFLMFVLVGGISLPVKTFKIMTAIICTWLLVSIPLFIYWFN